MNTTSKNIKQKQKIKIIAFFAGLFLLIIALFFINFYFRIKEINFSFFDENPENIEIKSFTENLLRKEASTLLGYFFIDQDLISKLVHDELTVVENVKISKKFPLKYDISITKNDRYFYTCVPEDYNFLISCMLGNSSGAYYKEIVQEPNDILKVSVDRKVLFDAKSLEKIEETESLSGTRIYNKEDFAVLREILEWLKKNGFNLKGVDVGELKILRIHTDVYTLKVSLDKSFVDTVKDFELISKTGKLQEYINDKKNEVEYIDLSFKDRVFYKLKNNTENATMSTTSNATSTLQ